MIRSSIAEEHGQKPEADPIPISDVILIIFFGILLHSWDVYSDIALMVKLYYEGFEEAHYMLGPVLA